MFRYISLLVLTNSGQCQIVKDVWFGSWHLTLDEAGHKREKVVSCQMPLFCDASAVPPGSHLHVAYKLQVLTYLLELKCEDAIG